MGFGIRITSLNFGLAFGATVAGLIAASPASAQTPPPAPPTFHCQELIRPTDPDLPVLKPIFRSTTDLAENEFDCLAWQDFIYLMWPALPNQRGVPDPNRKIGASGPTVWESYRTADTVFLPQGRDPGPWQQLQLMATLQPSLAQQVASGAVRNLDPDDKSVGTRARHHPAERGGISAAHPARYLASRRRHALRPQRLPGLLRSGDG